MWNTSCTHCIYNKHYVFIFDRIVVFSYMFSQLPRYVGFTLPPRQLLPGHPTLTTPMTRGKMRSPSSCISIDRFDGWYRNIRDFKTIGIVKYWPSYLWYVGITLYIYIYIIYIYYLLLLHSWFRPSSSIPYHANPFLGLRLGNVECCLVDYLNARHARRKRQHGNWTLMVGYL